MEGESVAISTGAGACQISGKEARAPTASPKVRLARKTVVPARCVMHVDVTSAESELHLVVNQYNSSKTPISLASGVADIYTQISFRFELLNRQIGNTTCNKE
jgi:hypothetical protein